MLFSQIWEGAVELGIVMRFMLASFAHDRGQRRARLLTDFVGLDP